MRSIAGGGRRAHGAIEAEHVASRAARPPDPVRRPRVPLRDDRVPHRRARRFRRAGRRTQHVGRPARARLSAAEPARQSRDASPGMDRAGVGAEPDERGPCRARVRGARRSRDVGDGERRRGLRRGRRPRHVARVLAIRARDRGVQPERAVRLAAAALPVPLALARSEGRSRGAPRVRARDDHDDDASADAGAALDPGARRDRPRVGERDTLRRGGAVAITARIVRRGRGDGIASARVPSDRGTRVPTGELGRRARSRRIRSALPPRRLWNQRAREPRHRGQRRARARTECEPAGIPSAARGDRGRPAQPGLGRSGSCPTGPRVGDATVDAAARARPALPGARGRVLRAHQRADAAGIRRRDGAVLHPAARRARVSRGMRCFARPRADAGATRARRVAAGRGCRAHRGAFARGSRARRRHAGQSVHARLRPQSRFGNARARGVLQQRRSVHERLPVPAGVPARAS